jgi:hypothetical protein
MAEQARTIAAVQMNISLSMLEDKCESFMLTPYALHEAVSQPMDQYEFNFSINFNLNHDTKRARVSSVVKLLERQSDNTRKELAELKSTHVFFIQNFEEIIQTLPNGLLNIPNPLMEICNGISVSSIRGMYSVKKENTVFEHAVLPLLDPKALLPTQSIPAAQQSVAEGHTL